MKWIVPAYYPQFRCIAQHCQHSCCIGWEIDIDEDTAAFYKTLPNRLDGRLDNAIAVQDDVSSFILTKDERCPFLNTNGLCDIICTYGEGALCHICADHPRFRNYFADRTEIGLGLCCEEATRVILTSDNDALIVWDDDGEPDSPDEDELALLAQRENLFAIARDTTLTVREREQAILRRVGCAPLSAAALFDRLQPLERLDTAWDATLALLTTAPDTEPPDALSDAFTRLFVYFLYRHLADAAEDDRFAQRAAFVAHSVKTLRLLCAAQGNTFDALCDLCRRYSAEIEYSDENIDTLLNGF